MITVVIDIGDVGGGVVLRGKENKFSFGRVELVVV